MNEEIEYAEMLEIPVSTVNIARKPIRRKRKTLVSTPSEELRASEKTPQATPLKETVIAQVNERLSTSAEEETQPTLESVSERESFDGRLDFEPIPDRIDTVRIYGEGDAEQEFFSQDFSPSDENGGGRYALNKKSERLSKGIRVALGVEFVAACALCGAIFLTNVFMPNSAINTFFRNLASPSEIVKADTRSYTDFTLTPVVSELSNAELTLSPAGILSFTNECCVYPTANGSIANVTQDEQGLYTVKLSHSDTFTGVISGLNQVYYAVGDEVKANVPLGYTDGEEEVQVTMYSNGMLLNCFQLTEENCLAWVADATDE